MVLNKGTIPLNITAIENPIAVAVGTRCHIDITDVGSAVAIEIVGTLRRQREGKQQQGEQDQHSHHGQTPKFSQPSASTVGSMPQSGKGGGGGVAPSKR